MKHRKVRLVIELSPLAKSGRGALERAADIVARQGFVVLDAELVGEDRPSSGGDNQRQGEEQRHEPAIEAPQLALDVDT